jgi:hypothetical protein
MKLTAIISTAIACPLALIVLSACGGGSGVSPSGASGTSTASPTSSPTPAVTPSPTPEPALPPATVPPAAGVSECSLTLQIGADGNAGPLFCADGGINVLAWSYFAKDNPLVMALSSAAVQQQVETAMCTDLKTSTIPIETSAGQLAFRYYGWKFSGIGDITTAFPGFCS